MKPNSYGKQRSNIWQSEINRKIRAMKTEDAIQRFAETIVSRMEKIKENKWEKGWLTTSYNGNPCNLTGREYNGMNAILLLFMQMEDPRFKLPIYATYKQIQEKGATVKKGEKSLPVLYWNFVYYDKKGEKISEDVYNGMNEEQRKGCSKNGYLKVYHVFNIEQTTLEEDVPQVMEKIKDRFGITTNLPADTLGMYENPEIDDMLALQRWICPVHYQDYSGSAFYRPSTNEITVPMKSQFKRGETKEVVYSSGQEFYSTLIHEMVHSTSKVTGRKIEGHFGDDGYGREELVAEFGAALVCNALGFCRKIEDNNIAYLSCWIKAIKKDPKFLLTVLGDVSKATKIVFDKIKTEQKQAVVA